MNVGELFEEHHVAISRSVGDEDAAASLWLELMRRPELLSRKDDRSSMRTYLTMIAKDFQRRSKRAQARRCHRQLRAGRKEGIIDGVPMYEIREFERTLSNAEFWFWRELIGLDEPRQRSDANRWQLTRRVKKRVKAFFCEGKEPTDGEAAEA